jgi:tripartite-type tricarboxylate transporter receptor subunit TctC
MKKLHTLVFALLSGTTLHSLALAQGYPSKPIRIVVPFPPGGATDIIARAVGADLTRQWGQAVPIENRAGAGGNLGADAVAKSAPDGYTLVMATVGTHAINMSLYSKMPYDTVKDFAPVSLVAAVPNILVVHPSVPAKSVKELIDLARAKPGEINFASSGNGTSIHLSGELFKTMTGVQMTHIPFNGSGPAMASLLGGQTTVMFDNMPSALPHVRAGKLRALAVTTITRAPATPELPTIAESGLAGFDASSWFGILGPAGTPREIVTKLSAAIAGGLKNPEMRDRLSSQGAAPVGSTPEEFAAHIQSEIVKWAKVVKASGAKLD